MTNDEIDMVSLVDAVVERLQPQLDEWFETVEQDFVMMFGDEFDRLFRDRMKFLVAQNKLLDEGKWEEEFCEGGAPHPSTDELRFLVGRTELLLERTNMLEQILEKKHPKCVGEWEEEKCEGGGSAPITAAPWHGFKRRSL